MKNFAKFLGAMRSIAIIAMAAVIGFTFASCDNGSGDGGGTAPTVTTASLPGGTVGTAYSQTLAATGDTPITWGIDSGSLPGGLNLSTAGVISGTPTTAGTSNFTVKATNAKGNVTKALSIVIASSGESGTAPTVTTTSLPGGTVGTAYSQTLAATGDTPITWSIDSGSLPGGLNLSTAGVISGNPTTANTFNFTVKATNAAGSVTKTLSIVIASSSGGDSLTINITNLTASTEYKVRPALQTSNASGMHDKVATSDASGTLTVTFTKDDFASFWGRDMYIFYAPSNTFSILDGKHTKTTYKMETKTLTLHGVDDFQSR
jgi:hypothetical protein